MAFSFDDSFFFYIQDFYLVIHIQMILFLSCFSPHNFLFFLNKNLYLH